MVVEIVEKLEIQELLNKGNSLQTQGYYKDAIEYFNEVIRIEPGHAVAYHRRGIAHSSLGQHKLAIEDYEKATRLDPNDEGAYHNLASTLDHIDTNKALKAWGRYLQMAKSIPPGKVWIEDVLKKKGDLESTPS